ncbi:MAG: right-handed parallel beta-helix repeat-containing protein, partial [Nanoarchaeota archaeon]
MPDTTKPRLNASLDISPVFQDVIVNMTANVSDGIGLSFCQFIDNMTLANGAKNYYNKTVAGTNDQCSQNYTIGLPLGSVINFTVIVNDTSNNLNQSEYAGNVIGQIVEVRPLNCTKLNKANAVYNLTTKASSPGTCMYVLANNVTLDCKGFDVNYSQSVVGYGINNSGFNYSMIKSCNIVQNVTSMGGASNSYGIYIFKNASFNTIYNNSITTNSSNGYGIYLLNDARNNNITNNTITTSGSSGYSVSLGTSSNNSVYSNTITTSGTFGYGAYLDTSSNNSVYSNTITTSGGNGRGAYLYSSSNNSIYSNTIMTSGSSGYGTLLDTSSDNNNVYSNTITTSGGTGLGAVL